MTTETTPDQPKIRSAARTALLVCVRLAVLGVVAASLLGHLGRHGLIFELMSHFRVQYALLLLVGAATLLALRSRRLAILTAAVGMTDVVAVWPYVMPARHAALAAVESRPSLRVLSQNVNTANDQFAQVLSLVEAEQPDVVLLLEVNARWMVQMRPLDASYPYHISSPRSDNFGIALWSRLELLEPRIEPMTETAVPTIIARINAPAGELRFVGTHPLPPVSSRYLALRNEQLGLIAAEAARRDLPTIVAGDLNITPWSPAFADLLRNGHLHNTSRGHGLQRTWPASNWLMRIPIDHVLVSSAVHATSRRVGPDVGSDHRAVIADLRVSNRP